MKKSIKELERRIEEVNRDSEVKCEALDQEKVNLEKTIQDVNRNLSKEKKRSKELQEYAEFNEAAFAENVCKLKKEVEQLKLKLNKKTSELSNFQTNKKGRYETRRDCDKYRQSELKGEIVSNEEVLNEVESLR